MKAFTKRIIRDIRQQWVQFVSIVLIVALGVSFFIGIRVTGSDMKDTAQFYYSSQHLADIQLVSTLGFDDDSVQYLREQFPELTFSAQKYQDYVVNVHQQAMSLRLFAYEAEGMNQPTLLEGQWPETTSEVALDSAYMASEGLTIGDVIVMEDPDNTLDEETLTIVGSLESVLFLNVYRGASSVGDGKLSGYAYVDPKAFTSSIYTALWVQIGSDDSSFSTAYSDSVEGWVDVLEEASEALGTIRLSNIKAPLQEEIDEAQANLDSEVSQSNQTFEKARDELEQAQTKLDQGKQSLDEGIQALYTSLGQTTTVSTIPEQLAQLSEAIDALESTTQAQIDQLSQQIETVDQAIAAGIKQGMDEASLASLQATKQQLQTTYAQVASNREASLSTLKQAHQQLTEAYQIWVSGNQTLVENRQTLADAEAEAQTTIEAAQAEIDQAKKDLENLETPELYVQVRKEMVVGYGDFVQDSDRIAAIGQVFPAIFFLVAALICLSSIRRMVEEERTQTGVLQALGYTPRAVQLKYFIYAGSACLLGSLGGIAIGFYVIPSIIFDAYRILYNMPAILAAFKWEYAWLPLVAALLCTVGVAGFISFQQTRHTPASLMRPAAPKAGKRIFFERLPFLWKRLSFLHKVSLRNLFLDRSRFWMSVIGIAGCMGLLITGFGLNGSIKPLVSMQFDQITHYNSVVSLSNQTTSEQRDQLLETIDQTEMIREALPLQSTTVETVGATSIYEATLTVVEHEASMEDFITLRQASNQEKLELNDEGVIIDQKLSELLDLNVGDLIEVRLQNKIYAFKVSAIMENYIGHVLYMTPTLYEAVMGKTSQWNSVLLNLTSTSDQVTSAISSTLMQQDTVLAVTHLKDSQAAFADMMGSFDIVVVVIAGAASLLAFVVMINLTSMNINERVKEIATLKVLGFYDRENAAYIMRENLMLVVIGCVGGLGFGYFLHQYIIRTVEVDLIMFYRSLSWDSMVIATGLTFVFALVVNLVMNRRIKKIDMIEALKSVD